MTTEQSPPDAGEASPADGPDVAPATDTDAVPETLPSWEQLGVSSEVRQALEDLGYLEPMPVQAAVFEHLRAGKDMMVQARTGTGKTAAFGIPLVQNLDESEGVKALLLTPTRELALQVCEELKRIARFRDIAVVPVYGGAPIKRQMEQLAAGAQVVCGTPGRVLDHIRRKTLKTDGIRILVLDECDEMLSMGFQEEIEAIIERLPGKESRQTLLFSATIPDAIERIARKHLTDPEKIQLSEGGISVEEIDHAYYIVSGMARMRDLLKVITVEEPESAIIFCNTRDETASVAKYLTRHGYDAEAISSDLSQKDRERVMGRMREKNLRFLVATDIAARGIDISDLPYVINYTFPESAEVYVHRTGRTGRAGNRGIALSLVGPREIGSFYYLKLTYKIQPEERDLPGNEVIAAAIEGDKLKKLTAKLRGAEISDEYRTLAQRLLQSDDAESAVAALLMRLATGGMSRRKSRSETSDRAETSDRDRGEERDEGRRRRQRRDREGDGDRDDRRRRRSRRDRNEDREEGDGRRRRRQRRRRDSDEEARTAPDAAESAESLESTETAEVEGEVSEAADTEVAIEARDDGDGRRRRRRRRRRSGADDADAGSAETDESANTSADPSTASDAAADDSSSDSEDEIEAAPVAEKETKSRSRDKKKPKREESESDSKPAKKSRSRKSKNKPRSADVGEDGKEFWETWVDENKSQDESKDADNGAEEDAGDASVRLYVNIGKREEISADEVRSILAEGLEVEAADRIGSVALRNTHSYVRVPEDLVDAIIAAAEGKSVGDRDVVVERARR